MFSQNSVVKLSRCLMEMWFDVCGCREKEKMKEREEVWIKVSNLAKSNPQVNVQAPVYMGPQILLWYYCSLTWHDTCKQWYINTCFHRHFNIHIQANSCCEWWRVTLWQFLSDSAFVDLHVVHGWKWCPRTILPCLPWKTAKIPGRCFFGLVSHHIQCCNSQKILKSIHAWPKKYSMDCEVSFVKMRPQVFPSYLVSFHLPLQITRLAGYILTWNLIDIHQYCHLF